MQNSTPLTSIIFSSSYQQGTNLSLALMLLSAVLFFVQTTAVAEEITWNFTGVVSYTDRPDIGEVGDLIEMQISVDANAENESGIFSDDRFLTRAVTSASASVNGIELELGPLAETSSLLIADNFNTGYDSITWSIQGETGVGLNAYFSLPTYVIQSYPELSDTFVANMIALAGSGSFFSSMSVSLGVFDSVGASPMSTYTFEEPPPVDTDDDGVPDTADNCTDVENTSQNDTDGDGFGNACDGDFDNNCVVNFFDIIDFSNNFLSTSAVHDINSDGVVNFSDYLTVIDNFLMAPGPSATGVCP